MNPELDRLCAELRLDEPAQAALRLRFGHACAERVRHLLEAPEALACLDALGRYVAGALDEAALAEWAARAAALANRHPGSRSIDGAGHAAVSATYAVANALTGKARQAADYAAYAQVYGGGGYGAVADLASFGPEHAWQVGCLRRLAAR